MIYQFYQESKEFYRVRANSKEEALQILESSQQEDKEEIHYDRTETCMKFIFNGVWSDAKPLHPLDGVWEEVPKLEK